MKKAGENETDGKIARKIVNDGGCDGMLVVGGDGTELGSE